MSYNDGEGEDRCIQSVGNMVMGEQKVASGSTLGVSFREI